MTSFLGQNLLETPKAAQTFSVLLVDDSEDDRLFLQRALSKNPQFRVVGEAGDGEAAIAYLSGQGEFSDRQKHPLPDVLLLDLKMPRVDGYEVLEWVRTRNLNQLRIVVLSGSFLPADITRCRDLGVAAYYKKEALQEEHTAIIADVERLLTRRVQL